MKKHLWLVAFSPEEELFLDSSRLSDCVSSDRVFPEYYILVQTILYLLREKKWC